VWVSQLYYHHMERPSLELEKEDNEKNE